MRKTGFVLFVLAFAVLARGQQTQAPASQPQQTQAPASLQRGLTEPPPIPRQVSVSRTNLVEKADAPTYADMNCAGFISTQAVPEGTYVTSGWDSPSQTRFASGQYVYFTGSGFQEGQQYAIIRKLKDPNRWEGFAGQHSAVAQAGQPYSEIAQLTPPLCRAECGATRQLLWSPSPATELFPTISLFLW